MKAASYTFCSWKRNLNRAAASFPLVRINVLPQIVMGV